EHALFEPACSYGNLVAARTKAREIESTCGTGLDHTRYTCLNVGGDDFRTRDNCPLGVLHQPADASTLALCKQGRRCTQTNPHRSHDQLFSASFHVAPSTQINVASCVILMCRSQNSLFPSDLFGQIPS